MVNCESTQSYKVPLKACQNSVIEHNLVTIWLSVEWPERGGDDPNLVIDITNKQPSTPYLPQNQSSVLVNSVHHHHQHQENVGLTYQQQYYHSSAINNHDPSSSTTAITIGDHNDVLATTTTTVLYNPGQPQLQRSTSPTRIQQIKRDLISQLSPIILRQPTLNQQYLPSQHIVQTSSTNMNDPRSNMPKPTISPTSSIKPVPSVMTQFTDLQQPPTMNCLPSTLKTSLFKSLVCTCPDPTSYHVRNCAIFTPNNQESNMNLSSESMHRQPINRTNTQQTVFTPQTPANSTMSINSNKEPMLTTTFMPFPNSNLMKTPDSSSSVTTIISQPPSFFNNTQIGPTIKTPSLDTDNIFQQSLLNFPHISINNQSNYQSNPSIPTEIVGQQSNGSTNSRQRKKSSTKRNNSINQDQQSFQNLNNSQQQIHFINNPNSPIKQQNINSPNHLSSPIQTKQGMFMFQDNSQITDNTVCHSANDIKGNTTQQNSPQTNSMIRSPVKLDVPASLKLNQTKVSPEDVDQTISEVIKGKVDISIRDSSTSTVSQQKKPSLSSQLVWESNGPTTTRTYVSSLDSKQQLSSYNPNISTLNRQNVVEFSQQVIRPNFTEQNQMNTLSQPPPATKTKKKSNRLNGTNKSESKRIYKPTINLRQQTTLSSSHQDISHTTTSPITSTSHIINKQMSWPDTPISLSSTGSVVIAPIENPNQHLTNESLTMQDMDHDGMMLNYSGFQNEHVQIIYQNDRPAFELDDIFSSKIDDPFVSSTPPPLPSASITDEISNSTSAKKSSSTLITSINNSADIYEDFLPSDPQNNHSLQQQYYSQTDQYFNPNLQPQTLTSKSIETNSNSVNQMNNNDDVLTLSRQEQQEQQQEQQQQQQQPKKTTEKTNHQSQSIKKKSSKYPSKVTKQRTLPKSSQKQSSTKPRCTRCGLTQLIDITHHEFPKQKGLVFECVSCGNNSMRSNVSAHERKGRLAKVAADHLNNVTCLFCHTIFHSHKDYLSHLKNDHGSNKPL